MSPGGAGAIDPVAKQIEAVLDGWLAEIFPKPKQESASQICTDFKLGLITGRQAQQMLVGLGYSYQAALRILSICYLRQLPRTLQAMPAPGSADYKKMQDALES